MKKTVNRRRFITTTAKASALASIASGPFIGRAQSSPSSRIVVGVMGLGRGMAHVRNALALKDVEVGAVCDIDESRLNSAMDAVKKTGWDRAKGVDDFRRMLDNKDIDAIMIATCNHWHAPATILACSAGKHVYVEKPGSHNPHEGEMMVAAARKNNRVVQMGNQRRTWPAIIEAIDMVRSGQIGKVTYARSWYNNARGSIGKGKQVPVPANLNYDIWQGPAPERPYKDNLVHYNWHWHWHWGNGELGNNGIHALDLCRWGLDVDYPSRVTYNGGRFHFDDDQETPDTGTAVFDFGDKGASWECSSCLPRKDEKQDFVRFYGTKGTIAINGSGYRILDLQGEEIAKKSGEGGDRAHMGNFFDCIRSGETPNSEIEIGQKSTMMCHLGNMAYRTGSMVHFDPKKKQIINNPAAEALWTRDYRPGWEPVV
jgi:predicted dehydrogenase